MLRKILVLAGGESGVEQPAVTRAAALAQRAGAAVSLLDTVYDGHLEGYLGHSEIYEPLRERIVAERSEKLRALARELESRGLRCEAKAVWAHPAYMAVVRAAAAPDVDLVVMEPAELLGGLSQDEWRVISLTPAPVLVARGDPNTSWAVVVAAVDPQRAHGKPADLDLRILEQAKRMRDLSGARLEVLHCIAPLAAFFAEATTDEAMQEAERGLMSQRTHELAELVEEAGLPAEAATLARGRPADVLAERSASGEATLLVLGSVSRGPIARLLIGSTAERVLRSAGGDVLVLKPPVIDLAPGDLA